MKREEDEPGSARRSDSGEQRPDRPRHRPADGSPIAVSVTDPSVGRSLTMMSCCERRGNLSGLLVRRGVVGDLEEVQVDHLLHLVVVPSPLAHDDGGVEQEDVSAFERRGGSGLIILIPTLAELWFWRRDSAALLAVNGPGP